jgi:hypothetical protein
MPFSTPYLSLTDSSQPPEPSPSLIRTTNTRPQTKQQPTSHHSSSLAARTASGAHRPQTSVQASARLPQKSTTQRRRSTLTSRFPLLRKSSREVTGTPTPSVPSVHIRGSSGSSTPPSQTVSPFLSTGDPRASISSTRSRIERNNSEPHLRDSSIDSRRRPSLHREASDNASRHSATSLLLASPSTPEVERTNGKQEQNRQRLVPASSARAPDKKMHQTSSRLLRMTEDERPFTKVSDRRVSFRTYLWATTYTFYSLALIRPGFTSCKWSERYKIRPRISSAFWARQRPYAKKSHSQHLKNIFTCSAATASFVKAKSSAFPLIKAPVAKTDPQPYQRPSHSHSAASMILS